MKQETLNIEHLVNTSVEDCRSSLAFASREQLIAAHRWCEGHAKGNATRKQLIAAALRRMELVEARGRKPETRKKK